MLGTIVELIEYRLDQDTIGPIGFTVHNLALMLRIMSGPNELDHRSELSISNDIYLTKTYSSYDHPGACSQDCTQFTDLPYANFSQYTIGIPHKLFLDSR